MNRRAFLLAASGLTAAAITPEAVYAAAANAQPEWALAVGDIEADLAPQPLKLIHGRAPEGLSGTLYRNGPARFRRPGANATHWFDGDGLMRAFQLRDGQAQLRARFVDTAKRRADTAANAVITPGFGTKGGAGAHIGGNDDTNAANTSVIAVGGQLWALWEAGSPYAMDRDSLVTLGPKTLRPDLAHMPFTAHPRIEPTGRIWNLGQNGKDCIVWRIAPSGELEKAELIELPRASYIHDFTATDRHLIIVLQPWVQDHFELPYANSLTWRPELATQVLVLDKDDLSRRKVYELPAFFFFHLGDAWADSAGAIHFDACIDADAGFAASGASALLTGRYTPGPAPRLVLVSLGVDGLATMTPSGGPGEFPRADARFAGGQRRFTTHSAVRSASKPLFQGVAVTDWTSQTTQTFDYGVHQAAEELLFVPRPGGSDEFDGWLIGSSLNLKARATELHVFDARRVAEGPLASWRAQAALPVGFHGAFVQA